MVGKLVVGIADDLDNIHNDVQRIVISNFKEVEFKDFYDLETLINYVSDSQSNLDLLFLDNDFGFGITGIETLPELRDYAPALPITLLTTEERIEVVKKAIPYDITYLAKPIRDTQLIMHISEVLERKKQYQKQLKQWSVKLLELQGADSRVLTNLDNERDWQVFQDKLTDIAIQMKKYNMEHQGEVFNNLRKKLKGNFRTIDDTTLDFLATGEFLYQIHKNNRIDFSAILIGFCKAIELQLTYLLRKRHFINENSKSTIGDSLTLIRKHNIFNNNRDILSNLETIRNYRNNCAHPNEITYEIVEKARNLIVPTRGVGVLRTLLDAY